MKTHLVFATLFLTSLAAFGVHTQPSPSSQFRRTHSRQIHSRETSKANHRNPPHVNAGAVARPATAGKTTGTNPAAKGGFGNRTAGSSTATPVTLVGGARFPLSGLDDDNTLQVAGDFNGDGKADVAKIVQNGETYSISVLLGNGDGTFQAAKLTATPNDTDDPILVGDVNGDGKDDIVMVHPGDECGGVRKPASAHAASAHAVSDCVASSTDGLVSVSSSMDVLLSNGDGTFATAVNYAITGIGLRGGVLADINGDGNLDVLVFDNAIPANVIELLGSSTGTFQAAATLAPLSAAAPENMIFADFNGDGKLDFAGDIDGQIQVTLGTGSGTFALPALLTVPEAVYNTCTSVAGDLTGDGKPEIVALNCNSNTLTVYVNNGDGTFQSGISYNNNGDQSQYPYGATIGDMNGDGKNDIVVVNEGTADVSVFLGDGTGAVTVGPLSYDVGGFAWAQPLVADFNGDGLIDVVESDDEYNLVYLQGYGDGSVRAAPSYDLPNSFSEYADTYSVATGDFNGDGIPDVVVGQENNYGSTGVTVYLAKGDGSFYPGISYGASSQMGYVAVADFNGDGKLDIAATDSQGGVVQIFLGNGDGTFSIGGAYPTDAGEGPYPENVVTGDFNHDGVIDLAIANPETSSVGVLLGNGDGTFAAAVSYPVEGYYLNSITAADLNGDGFVDLAVAAETEGPGAIAILLANNDKSGTFQAATFYNVDGIPDFVTFGDLNKDGNVDMAVTLFNGITYPGTVEIALGNGDGTFKTGVDYASSAFGAGLSYTDPGNIQIIDWNGDGNPDLVYVNSEVGTLAIMLGNGDGTVSAPVEFPVTEYAWGMALADVNNDGAVDVLVGNDESGGFSVLLNGAGSGTAPNFTIGTGTASATVTAGSPATYVLNLAGQNGYTGTITFTCGALPAEATCSFSPVSVIALGNTALTTTLTIDTTAAGATSLLRPARPGAMPVPPISGSPMWLASLSGMGLLSLLLSGSGAKGRRRRATVLLGVVLLVTLGALAACGNSSHSTTTTTPPPPNLGTPAGSYTVTVTSTGTGTAAPTHSVNVTMIVQ
jgi:FG-GAP-like repeat